jgi:hypothetical protein
MLFSIKPQRREGTKSKVQSSCLCDLVVQKIRNG